MTATKWKAPASTRQVSRFSYLRDVSIHYEGRDEELTVHLPDISSRGMFINTANVFPEGTILKVSFRLERSGHHVVARGEVRYCLPGVGVGLEFIDLPPTDQKAIETELRQFNKRS